MEPKSRTGMLLKILDLHDIPKGHRGLQSGHSDIVGVVSYCRDIVNVGGRSDSDSVRVATIAGQGGCCERLTTTTCLVPLV